VIRFCSLGSGSGGNALLVEVSHGSRVRRLLVDCGFGPRTLAQRLQARAGLALTDLDGLLLTHEHADHVAGVRALLARHTLTVAATRGTWLACGLDTAEPRWLPISPGSEFTLADAQIFAVPVAHDAGYYWPRRGWYKKPGTVRVVIGPPIKAEGRDPREVNAEAQAWIEAHSRH